MTNPRRPALLALLTLAAVAPALAPTAARADGPTRCVRIEAFVRGDSEQSQSAAEFLTKLADGREGVDSLWIRPADAVAEAEAGRRTIIFPTLLNVKKLGRSASVAEALAAARRHPIVTVLPRVAHTDHGDVLRIPAEAGYDLSEAPLEGLA